jgi:hypothetical protein
MGEKKKPLPFDQEQHKKFAGELVALASDLRDMRQSVEAHYPATGEAARACREMHRQFERVRAYLNSRYFSEGRSADGTTPYYPPGGLALNPPASEDLEGDDDGDGQAAGED